MQLLTCQPLVLIPVNGQKPEIGGAKIGLKNGCSARPWGRQAVILINSSFILVNCVGESPQKKQKQNGLFVGVPGTFTRSKYRLRLMPGNKAVYGPSGPGNKPQVDRLRC